MIDENRIRENLKEISFPRLSGTVEESRVFDILFHKLNAMNLKPNIQKFKFSTFYSRVYLKISIFVGFWILFSFYINLSAIFTFISITITFILFSPFFLLTRKPENIRIGKVLESKNIFLKFDANSPDKADYNLLFMAHLDSKGQTITVRTRGLITFTYAISIIFLIIVLILRIIFVSEGYWLFTYIGIVPMVMMGAVTLIFCLNRTNNKSKGVIDDASGAVCTLELLTHFIEVKKNIEKANIWFVFTGAEETGTMGIRYFHKLLKDLDKEKTFITNFESLGKSLYIFITKELETRNPKYSNFFTDNAKKYMFKSFFRGAARGIHTDGMYLAGKGFNLFEYSSREVGKFMHSESDSLDKVDITLLKNICEFNFELLDYFDKDYPENH